MLKKTGIDDEAIKTSENMLLTFTRIRNEAGENNRIFDRATESVADLATAMNQGAVPSADQMQRASIQLGKALNDPIKGVGALARVGIQFTKRQKDQIKTLVESGKTMEAQKVILAELNKEVGGRAAAAGKTFSGQWRILTETLNNLTGVLAAKLMPTIQKYLEMAVRWISNSQNQKKVIDAVSAAGHALEDRARHARRRLQDPVQDRRRQQERDHRPGRRLRHLQGRADRVHGHEPGLELRPARHGGRTAAKAASQGLAASFLGKAGLVAAVGIASFQITSMILKMTKLDKKLKDFGGSVFDIASSLGLTEELDTREEAIARIVKQNPRRARQLQGGHFVRGRDRPVQVNVQVDGKTIAKATARPPRTSRPGGASNGRTSGGAPDSDPRLQHEGRLGTASLATRAARQRPSSRSPAAMTMTELHGWFAQAGDEWT